MEVVINGRAQGLPDGATVRDMLAQLAVRTEGTAVEVNREIVPRSEYARRRLNNGDAIEIVTFVGGG